MRSLIVILFLGLFFILSAQAERPTSLLVGSGFLGYNFGKVTTSTDRSAGVTGETFALPLHLVGFVKVRDRISISPHFLYTFLPNVSADNAGNTTVWYVGVPVVYEFGKNWEARGGLGYFDYTLNGNGGLKGSFGLPSGSISARNYTIELGIGQTKGLLNGNLDLIFTAPFDNYRRAVSLFLSFNYALVGGYE